MVVLLLTILLLPSPYANAASTSPRLLGINYAMSYWHYDLQTFGEASTVRDFRFFASQGVNTVILSPRWITLEPKEGVYNTQLIANLRRICQLAAAEELLVVIDFHVMSLKGNLHNPTWLPDRNLTKIITDARYREDFLTTSKYLADQLTGEPNVSGFSMLNEPHLGSNELNVDREQFVSFVQDLRAAYRTVTSKPLTIRFDVSLVSQFMLDDRLFAACDFIDLNFYDKWFSENKMYEAVYKAKSLGKQVWVTEFGYSGSDDDAQEQDYADYIDYFKTLDVDAIAPWVWKADSGKTRNPEPVGDGYNLAADADGNPRPAWYTITEFTIIQSVDWTVEAIISSGGMPIQGFSVAVTGPLAFNITTNSSGRASFTTTMPGLYTLTAVKDGYEAVTGSIIVTQNTTSSSILTLVSNKVGPEVDDIPVTNPNQTIWIDYLILIVTIIVSVWILKRFALNGRRIGALHLR